MKRHKTEALIRRWITLHASAHTLRLGKIKGLGAQREADEDPG